MQSNQWLHTNLILAPIRRATPSNSQKKTFTSKLVQQLPATPKIGFYCGCIRCATPPQLPKWSIPTPILTQQLPTPTWRKKRRKDERIAYLYMPLRMEFLGLNLLPEFHQLRNPVFAGNPRSFFLKTLHVDVFSSFAISMRLFWALQRAKWVIRPWQLWNIFPMFRREVIFCWW